MTDQSGKRRKRLGEAGLLALLVAVALLGTLPWNGRALPFRASELRVLLCARTMAEGGDWLVPVYEEEVRINKPPLMYWLVAAVFHLVGGTESLALARGVNGLLGALLVASVYGCGRYWLGRRRAWLAAIIAATCYLFLFFARLCETDVGLTLFTTLSCFLIWMGADGRHGWAWWMAGVCSGIGFLFKGPAALVLPLVALVAGYGTGAIRNWKRGLVGILLLIVPFAGVVLPWYLYLFLGGSAGAAGKDIGFELSALIRESPHHGSWLYYLYTLPLLLLPWGIFLPAGLVYGWEARHHRGIRFILGWLIGALVVMTFVKSKQPHYAMLLLPPAALLTGGFLYNAAGNRDPGRYRATRVLLRMTCLGSAIAGLATMVLPFLKEGVPPWMGFVWGIPLVALAAWGLLMRHGLPVYRNLAVLASAMIWGVVGYGALFHEIAEPAALYRDCVAEARKHMEPGTQVFLAGRRAVPTKFYLHRPLHHVTDVAAAWQQARTGDLVIVSMDREHRRVLTMDPPSDPVFLRRQGEYELRMYVR